MRYQSKPHWCAVAAVQNALRVRGVNVGQSRLAKLLGTTDDGTDECDILRALGALGRGVSVLETDRKNDARSWLCQTSPLGPILLCVDSWAHWVTVAGGCHRRLWLFDPARVPRNTAENGSWPLLPKTILKRWRAARRLRKEGGLYYGIAVLT